MPSTSSLSSPRSSTSSLSNWLIGKPSEAGLDRGAVEQGGVGEQHPARVDGDVARQPVEPLDEVEEQVEPLVRPSPAARSSGRSRSAIRASRARMCGNALAIASISPGGMPSAAADVADRVADPVGVHHRDAGARARRRSGRGSLVDLVAPGGLDVDVDVGQRGPQRGEEPLHQQAVADRVDPGDAEQVVDQAARARPARRAPRTPMLADQVGDVADGQEVRRVAQAADHLQLVVEPLPDALARRAAVAAADAGLAASPSRRRRWPASRSHRRRHSVDRSNSGKWTSPSPRSARGSRAHRSATSRVWASSRWASRSVSPSPASRAISSATSASACRT